MNRTWMLVATVLLVLSGCKKSGPKDTIFVSGRIDGDTVDISSKIPGRIVNLAVREGDPVEAGQVVARLSSPQADARRDAQKERVVSAQRKVEQLQKQVATYDEKIKQAQLYVDQAKMDAPEQVEQAEANYATSKAELARQEAELKQSQVDAERYAPLAKTGAVAPQLAAQYQTKESIARASTEASRKQVAEAEAALDRSRAQLKNIPIKEADRLTLLRELGELREQIASAQADVQMECDELRKEEADVADLTIHAPIAGTILTRSAEPGRVIDAGQTIMTMVDLRKLYLRGFVPEGEVGKVKVGQRAEVFLDSNPKQPVPAQVIRIDPQVMFTPENTYFQKDRVKQVMGLKLGLRGAYGYAKPGMPADGKIYFQQPAETETTSAWRP
jgi:HlyD family secretion protein